jgi:GTP cyclohydrolase II
MEPIQTWLAEGARLAHHPGRPLVTLTYAQSLDGSIAATRSRPLALSGIESQTVTHWLRASHDAILVGIGTILADDPQLNVRLVTGSSPQPVILDSRLRFPPTARLLDGKGSPPWIAATPGYDPRRRGKLEAAGARLLVLPADASGRVDLSALLSCLLEMGVESLMVEGGARVITSFLNQQLVDRILITIAPLFVGGVHAPEGRSKPDLTTDIMKNCDPATQPLLPRLRDWDFARFGEDLLMWGRPDWGAQQESIP